MFAASFLQYVHLAHFSKPRSERRLYRAIRRQKVSSIVEIGIGGGVRAIRLVRVAGRYSNQQQVRYTGIDLFEARSQDRPGWTLKRAHRTLAALGARVQLIPGDPLSGLARSANGLTNTDIILISGDQNRESLAQAWFYVPRMLHEQSSVFVQDDEAESEEDAEWRLVDAQEIVSLAAEAQEFRQRAA